MCKGRAIAFRKSTSACEIVYRILENWSTGNENFVKEFEKTVDRFLKNCYDVCSEPKKTMQAEVRVRHGKYKNDLLSQNRFGACIL